jgi:hypothetical protein
MSGLTNFNNFMLGLKNNKFNKLDSEGKEVEVSFTLNGPADINEILKIEQELGKSLPKPYIDFLLKYDGARIFDYEGLDGFVILGTKDLIKTNKFVANTFEEDWIDSLIVFSKYIGEENFLAFDSSIKENAVVDCFVEELPQNWNVIASNFNDFMDRIITGQGSKYWL